MDRTCRTLGLLFLLILSRLNDELGEDDSALGGSTTPMMYASAKNFLNQGSGVRFGCMQGPGLFL